MKLLKIDETNREEIINKFVEELKEKLDKQDTDGVFRFTFDMKAKTQEKKNLFITPTAYIKMLLLVQHYSSEIGWYGTAERVENGGYQINDIFVYPQVVTGATVDTDQEKFQKWLDDMDAETFKKLRFNGHSHVEMAVLPSVVDMEGRESDLRSLRKDDFQIFMIMNKRNEFSVDIYDRRDNAIYEKEDINVYITDCAIDTFDIVSKSKELVERKVYTMTTPVKKLKDKSTEKTKKIFGSRYQFDDEEEGYDPTDCYYYNGYGNYGYSY